LSIYQTESDYGQIVELPSIWNT